MVGILILVNQNIPELPLIVPLDILVLLKKLHCHIDDVVKVQRVVVLQTGLIFCVAAGDVQSAQIARCFRAFQHFLRGYHLVLFPADSAKNILCWEGLVVKTHVLNDILHDPLGIGGVINGKAAGIAHFFNVPPQNPAAGRMKGHCPDILRLGAKQSRKPVTDFVGGLVCEGNRQDAPGRRRFYSAQPIRAIAVIRAIRFDGFQKGKIFLRNMFRNLATVAAPAKTHQICNPVNENRRFSASRACQQQKRAFRRHNSLPLHIIELRKLALNIAAAGR